MVLLFLNFKVVIINGLLFRTNPPILTLALLKKT